MNPREYALQMKMHFLLSIIAAATVHEAAHVLCARWLGVRVKRLCLSWTGMYLVRESGTEVQNLAITLAGPLANLVLSGAFVLTPWLGMAAIEFSLVNFALGLLNMLPLGSLDGNRALQVLLQQRAATD